MGRENCVVYSNESLRAVFLHHILQTFAHLFIRPEIKLQKLEMNTNKV